MENKFYIVVGSVAYEGECLYETGKAFSKFKKAQAYGAELLGQGYISYAVKEVEVE